MIHIIKKSASQLFSKIKKELPNLNIQIANGKFNHLINWLRSNVHSKGSLSNSEDLVKKVTGEELNIEYFKKHLINRYLN